MINIIKDIDLFDNVKDYDIVLVGTNIYCNLSQGFQRKVMLNYPYVQEMNMLTKYADKKKLGTILECKNEGNPTFLLLYITEGNFRPDLKKDTLSYESLEKCIKLINILYKGMNIACPFLGSSRFDGNGDKDKILKIIENNSKNVNITIFDYEQKSRAEELKETREKELQLKEENADAYYEAVKKRKEEAEERYKNNGHARY
jgi:hypothetical protein